MFRVACYRAVLVGAAIIPVFGSLTPVALASCEWQEFSSAPYQNPAFPETNATYLRAGFANGTDPREAVVRIRGKIEESRYVSFTVYDVSSNEVVAHLSDEQLRLDGSTYQIFMGSADALDAARRVLMVNGESSDAVNFVELDLPGRELWHRNYLGKVEGETMPEIDFFRTVVPADGPGQILMEPADCPGRIPAPRFAIGAAARIPPMNHRHEIKFFRSRGQMLYPNPDNFYLASRINPRAGHVATISFRPPPPGSMRYWSICLGGLNTTTSGCLHDRQILEANGLDPDSAQDPEVRVRVMFAPESWRHHAARSNMAFLPWGTHRREFIIYRNLLTVDSHPGNMGRVPPIRRSHLIPCRIFCRNWDRISAEKFIGDWAPVGWQQ